MTIYLEIEEEALWKSRCHKLDLGYLLRDISADDLVWAICAIHTGRATLSPETAQSLVEAANLPPAPGLDLTEREREVLAHMVEGLNITQIAGRRTSVHPL